MCVCVCVCVRVHVYRPVRAITFERNNLGLVNLFGAMIDEKCYSFCRCTKGIEAWVDTDSAVCAGRVQSCVQGVQGVTRKLITCSEL